MKSASAKHKGRKFQQQIRDLLITTLGIHEEDIESRSMGAGGEDIMMSKSAREKFPLSIECKNQESLNVWKSYKQAEANSGQYEPVLFMKRNNQKALIVVDAEFFVNLFKKGEDDEPVENLKYKMPEFEGFKFPEIKKGEE